MNTEILYSTLFKKIYIPNNNKINGILKTFARYFIIPMK